MTSAPSHQPNHGKETLIPGRVAGKAAFITGAARGQGRSHAIRLAREGADIVAVDLGHQVASVPYPMATPTDLTETVKDVEALNRRIIATEADVRDYRALKQALDDGVGRWADTPPRSTRTWCRTTRCTRCSRPTWRSRTVPGDG
jgi:hypothetical protein